MEFEARIQELQEDEFSKVGGEHDDLEDAASAYAEEVDPDCDYGIMKLGEVIVEIREVGNETIHAFKVIGEARPHYSASPITEPAPRKFKADYRTSHREDALLCSEIVVAKNRFDAARLIRKQNKQAWAIRISEPPELYV